MGSVPLRWLRNWRGCRQCEYTKTHVSISIYLSIYLSVDLSIYLSIYLSIELTLTLEYIYSYIYTYGWVAYLFASFENDEAVGWGDYTKIHVSTYIYIYRYMYRYMCIYVYIYGERTSSLALKMTRLSGGVIITKYTYRHIYVYIYVYTYIYVDLSIYKFIYLSIYLSIYLFICGGPSSLASKMTRLSGGVIIPK